jgi:hypothetical protein
MCGFIVVHERSIAKCDLINNIIKTIFPRSIVRYNMSLRKENIFCLFQSRLSKWRIILVNLRIIIKNMVVVFIKKHYIRMFSQKNLKINIDRKLYWIVHCYLDFFCASSEWYSNNQNYEVKQGEQGRVENSSCKPKKAKSA